MPIPILAAMILASSVATLAWAQQPMRMPSAPEAGSPGTATPQPYGQPSTAVPIKRQDRGSSRRDGTRGLARATMLRPPQRREP